MNVGSVAGAGPREGAVVNIQDQSRFWGEYDAKVRPMVERACRAASRSLSDGTMDPDDMASWVHQRVWTMLEASAYPTFHDDPSVEVAVERLRANVRTLARWAYLSMMRKHWRRAARQATIKASLSRAERLAMVTRFDPEPERDAEIRARLDTVKNSVSDRLRAKLAASWPERRDRERIAMALGAVSAADDALIRRTSSGEMKENTVQQMRSRAQRQVRSILNGLRRSAGVLLAAVVLLGLSAEAHAGEQSGGRKGGKGGRDAIVGLESRGEQSGGRKGGKDGHHTPVPDGEQGGGR